MAPLATVALDGAIQRKICGRGAIAISGAGVIKGGKEIILIISNEDMNDIITTVKLLGNSDVLIDRVSEALKHEMKKQESEFLSMLLGTLGASMLRYMLIGKSGLRAGRGYNNMDKILWFCSIL